MVPEHTDSRIAQFGRALRCPHGGCIVGHLVS